MELGVTAIDTSTNYLGFRSHKALAHIAGDLLPKFTISTKVAYFPGADSAEHSLAPVRLHAAVEQAARDIGREPDLVFLHNPEHSLGEGSPHPREVLARACGVLDRAAAKGLCGAWGIASWDPTPLPALIDATVPKPSVLMIRAGLMVGVRTLDAADALAAAWSLDSNMMWGMSPFGGSTRTPVWDRIDPRVFLRDSAGLSRVQAAFRTAYRLPHAHTMAMGTDEPAHLGELLAARSVEVDEQAIREYRTLLRDRLQVQDQWA